MSQNYYGHHPEYACRSFWPTYDYNHHHQQWDNQYQQGYHYQNQHYENNYQVENVENLDTSGEMFDFLQSGEEQPVLQESNWDKKDPIDEFLAKTERRDNNRCDRFQDNRRQRLSSSRSPSPERDRSPGRRYYYHPQNKNYHSYGKTKNRYHGYNGSRKSEYRRSDREDESNSGSRTSHRNYKKCASERVSTDYDRDSRHKSREEIKRGQFSTKNGCKNVQNTGEKLARENSLEDLRDTKIDERTIDKKVYDPITKKSANISGYKIPKRKSTSEAESDVPQEKTTEMTYNNLMKSKARILRTIHDLDKEKDEKIKQDLLSELQREGVGLRLPLTENEIKNVSGETDKFIPKAVQRPADEVEKKLVEIFKDNPQMIQSPQIKKKQAVTPFNKNNNNWSPISNDSEASKNVNNKELNRQISSEFTDCSSPEFITGNAKISFKINFKKSDKQAKPNFPKSAMSVVPSKPKIITGIPRVKITPYTYNMITPYTSNKVHNYKPSYGLPKSQVTLPVRVCRKPVIDVKKPKTSLIPLTHFQKPKTGLMPSFKTLPNFPVINITNNSCAVVNGIKQEKAETEIPKPSVVINETLTKTCATDTCEKLSEKESSKESEKQILPVSENTDDITIKQKLLDLMKDVLDEEKLKKIQQIMFETVQTSEEVKPNTVVKETNVEIPGGNVQHVPAESNSKEVNDPPIASEEKSIEEKMNDMHNSKENKNLEKELNVQKKISAELNNKEVSNIQQELTSDSKTEEVKNIPNNLSSGLLTTEGMNIQKILPTEINTEDHLNNQQNLSEENDTKAVLNINKYSKAVATNAIKKEDKNNTISPVVTPKRSKQRRKSELDILQKDIEILFKADRDFVFYGQRSNNNVDYNEQSPDRLSNACSSEGCLNESRTSSNTLKFSSSDSDDLLEFVSFPDDHDNTALGILNRELAALMEHKTSPKVKETALIDSDDQFKVKIESITYDALENTYIYESGSQYYRNEDEEIFEEYLQKLDLKDVQWSGYCAQCDDEIIYFDPQSILMEFNHLKYAHGHKFTENEQVNFNLDKSHNGSGLNVLKPWTESEMLKSVDNCEDLLSLSSIISTFKCMVPSCAFFTSDKIKMADHLEQHQLEPEDLLECSYCSDEMETADDLIDHVLAKHNHCQGYCAYCFYRSNPGNVMEHCKQYHLDRAPLVLDGTNDGVFSARPVDGKLLMNTIKSNVKPLICKGKVERYFNWLL